MDRRLIEIIVNQAEKLRNPFLNGKNAEEWESPTDSVRMFPIIRNCKLISSLRPGTSHLLLWIMMNSIKDCDVIYIDNEMYIEAAGYKTMVPYRKAISELISSNIIIKVPRHPDIFFINPSVFFNGNRIQQYKKLLNNKNIVVRS